MNGIADGVQVAHSPAEMAAEILEIMGIEQEMQGYEKCLSIAEDAAAYSRKRRREDRTIGNLREYMLEYTGAQLAPFYEEVIGKAVTAARLIDGDRTAEQTAGMLIELADYVMSDYDRIVNVRMNSMELTGKSMEGSADVSISRISERIGFHGDVALFGENGTLILASPLCLAFERWDSLIRRAEIYNDEICSRILWAAKVKTQQQGSSHREGLDVLKNAAGCEFTADSSMFRRAVVYSRKLRCRYGINLVRGKTQFPPGAGRCHS